MSYVAKGPHRKHMAGIWPCDNAADFCIEVSFQTFAEGVLIRHTFLI